MTADELHAQFQRAADSLKRCQCGSKVIMRYEPGNTHVACIGEREIKMALPDWQPIELAEKWNAELTHPESKP